MKRIHRYVTVYEMNQSIRILFDKDSTFLIDPFDHNPSKSNIQNKKHTTPKAKLIQFPNKDSKLYILQNQRQIRKNQTMWNRRMRREIRRGWGAGKCGALAQSSCRWRWREEWSRSEWRLWPSWRPKWSTPSPSVPSIAPPASLSILFRWSFPFPSR